MNHGLGEDQLLSVSNRLVTQDGLALAQQELFAVAIDMDEPEKSASGQ